MFTRGEHMTWDTTVSIEGLATALALLGAALGYVINLIRRWRQDAQDRAMLGTSFVILQLLEEELTNGLSEEELFRAYGSKDTLELRGKYSAMPPRKLSRVLFERRLRQLQFEGMVDPIRRDRWRVRVHPIDSHEAREQARAAMRQVVHEQVRSEELIAVAELLLRDARDSWRKKEALELLARINPTEGVAKIKSLLTSENREEALAAAEVLAELHKA